MKSVLSVACLAVAVLWVGPGLSAQDAPKQDAPPQEQEPKGPVTPEEAAREQIEKNYRAVLAGQDVKVTMEFRNARVQDVIEEFRRQVRVINFIVDLRNVPEEYRVDEFIVRNEPWRSALNAFVQKAELAIEEESPTLIRIIRPTPITVHFKDADIKTVVDVIARMSGANIIMDTGKG
ncbi:MAG: hypothetical protein HY716_14645, partial [Planctomycetes bacterium]|nr:hypothetical protein [Planctomycetota bacterium]